MNSNTSIKQDERPLIVISIGDESGVGPEIALKALASKDFPKDIKILIIGSKENLLSTYKLLKTKGIQNIANPETLDIQDPEIKWIEKNGESRAKYGNSSFQYLKKAIEIVKATENASLVTGPICKKSWALAGHLYSGQTELLAQSFSTSNVGMLFTAKSPITGWRFNTLLGTTHISIKDVRKKLNSSLIYSKLDLLRNFSKNFKKNIILKVAGLNPHAGEEGILGNEEIDLIQPTINQWKSDNPTVNLDGPLSPDSCWLSSAKAWRYKESADHDGILAMYHDQGLIPIKIIAANYSVNTTLGLPIIRTSPDHGTGFDIAGKGIAQCQSMLEAIKTARELNLNSRRLNSH